MLMGATKKMVVVDTLSVLVSTLKCGINSLNYYFFIYNITKNNVLNLCKSF